MAWSGAVPVPGPSCSPRCLPARATRIDPVFCSVCVRLFVDLSDSFEHIRALDNVVFQLDFGPTSESHAGTHCLRISI